MTASVRQIVISCDRRGPLSNCLESVMVWIDTAMALFESFDVAEKQLIEKGWLSIPVEGNTYELARTGMLHTHYCPAHSGQLPVLSGFYVDQMARVVQAVDLRGDGALNWRWIVAQNQDILMGEWIRDPMAVLALPLERMVPETSRRAIGA